MDLNKPNIVIHNHYTEQDAVRVEPILLLLFIYI